MRRTRYPRTPHVPWSPGASPDDVRAADLSGLEGREVVVTEKLDGENTTLYRDGLHARSPDSAHHPSRAPLKALHARIAHHIPAGWRVCGEGTYARHSIPHDDLPGWFVCFSVWDGDRALDWDATVRFATDLGLPTPRVRWRGRFDARALRDLPLDPTREEGWVVRTVAGFPREAFPRRVAKWVRRGHVQTEDTHWMLRPVVANGLGPDAVLWEVRSGGTPDVPALEARVGLPLDAECIGRLSLERLGEERLAAVLAAGLAGPRPQAAWLPALWATVGPVAWPTWALLRLHRNLHHPVDDTTREGGLVTLARAVDLAALHALAEQTAPDDDAREQVAWSRMVAEEAGLLARRPLDPWTARLAELLPASGLTADWLRGEALSGWAGGRWRSPEEAAAALHADRTHTPPHLILLVGPSGSGKSTVRRALGGVAVCLDDLRAEGLDDRAALSAGLDRLTAALQPGATVVWDATSLTPSQRALPLGRARSARACVTMMPVVAPPDVAAARNRARRRSVPDGVLAHQWRRLVWPVGLRAHRFEPRWVGPP